MAWGHSRLSSEWTSGLDIRRTEINNFHQDREESADSNNDSISNALVKDLDSICRGHVENAKISNKLDVYTTMPNSKQLDRGITERYKSSKAFISI